MFDGISPTIDHSGLLSPKECISIIEHANNVGMRQSSLLRRNDTSYYDLNFRRSKGIWIYEELPDITISDRLKNQVRHDAYEVFNADHYDQWIFQIAKYETGDFLSWHIDDGNQNRDEGFRKIATIVQLSDSSEYTGGDVEIENKPNLSRNRGDGVTILTTKRHRVTEVKSGTRYSMVIWLIGPKWR